MFLKILLCFTVCFVGKCITTQSHTIIAPKIVIPGENYTSIIAIQNLKHPTVITCTITKYDSALKWLKRLETHSSESYLTKDKNIQFCEIKIPSNLGNGMFELEIKGTDGYTFAEKFQIEYQPNQYIILVQTDKPVYKPGQTIMFRVLILDHMLMPVLNAEIKLYIIDPLGNKLTSFSNIDSSNNTSADRLELHVGVIDNLAFRLHDDAMIGDWRIQVVVIGNQVTNHNITVNHYNLPLAKLWTTMSDFIASTETEITILIYCHYYFDKPLNGLITVRVSVENDKDMSKTFQKSIYDKTPFTGKFETRLNLTSFLNESFENVVLNFSFIVEDSITKQNYILSKSVKVQNSNNNFIVECDDIQNFKPENIVEIKCKVKSLQNESMKEILNNITCIAKHNYGNSELKLLSKNNDTQNNEIICRFITDRNSQQIDYQLLYNNRSISQISLNANIGYCVQNLQIFTKNIESTIRLGETVELTVNSSHSFNRVYYYIVSRGIIRDFVEKRFQNHHNEQQINLFVKREFIPDFTITAFIEIDNMIISDTLLLKISEMFKPKVKLNIKTHSIDAGNIAKFSVEASKGSKVYLLAVDDSINALHHGNDIIESRITSQMSTTTTYDYTEKTAFLQSGMFYRSNTEPKCNTFHEMSVEFGVEFDYIFEQTYTFTSGVVKVDKTEVVTDPPIDYIPMRQDLRESWIFDEVFMHKNVTNLKAKVPHSITTWKLTAFAVNSEQRVMICENAGYVTVFRHFFLKLNLPFKIKSGETTELNILIFNYLNKTVVVDVNVTTDSIDSLTFESCSEQFVMNQNQIIQHSCNVTANINGRFNITAKADATDLSNHTISDGETKQLYVTFEGYETQLELSEMIDLSKNSWSVRRVNHSIGDEVLVNGSMKVFIRVTPYLLTNAWKISAVNEIYKYELKEEIPVPNGCCEQRFRQFFQLIFLLNYLNATNKLTDDQKNQAKDSMREYIKLLCFHNPNDGSFVKYKYLNPNYSTSLNNYVDVNTASSVWQTANTLRVLYYANKCDNVVDSEIIVNAIKWIENDQHSNGEFVEIDDNILIKTENKVVYHTAFVYTSMWLWLNNDSKGIVVNNDSLNKSVVFLEDNFNHLTDTLDVTICCYVFQLSNSDLKDECVDSVMNRSVVDNNGIRGMIGNHNAIASAYALMIFSHRKSYDIALEFFKLIISLPKIDGYYENSHLNCLSHEAMSKFIALLNHNTDVEQQIKVDFAYNQNMTTFLVHPNNGLVQSKQIDSTTRVVLIKASGYGMATASVLWSYNVKQLKSQSFSTQYNVTFIANGMIFVNVCNSYHKSNATVYNVITEIDLPSGFAFINISNNLEKFDRIEATNHNSHINLYIKQLTSESLCYIISTIRTHKVINLRPGYITIYDPYGERKQSSDIFEVDVDNDNTILKST